jgi:hypothetical protein
VSCRKIKAISAALSFTDSEESILLAGATKMYYKMLFCKMDKTDPSVQLFYILNMLPLLM